VFSADGIPIASADWKILDIRRQATPTAPKACTLTRGNSHHQPLLDPATAASELGFPQKRMTALAAKR